MNKKYIMVLDTETCPIHPTAEVSAFNMLTYDLGYSIIDLHGNIYLERSFVVANTFFGEEEKMQSAYYANKLPRYYEEMESGQRIPRTWRTIRDIIRQDIEEFGVSAVCAHNAFFDRTTLYVTAKYFEELGMIPHDMEWWDSMKMVNSTIAKKKKYIRFCEDNGFMTKHKTPRPQVKAEVVYKYLTGDMDFVESHTGLEDVRIEREILWACYRTHMKMEKVLPPMRKKNH